VDELNAPLWVSVGPSSCLGTSRDRGNSQQIQRDLWIIGNGEGHPPSDRKSVRILPAARPKALADQMAEMESHHDRPPRELHFASGTASLWLCNLAERSDAGPERRTVTYLAERVDQACLSISRLSAYLFVLARWINAGKRAREHLEYSETDGAKTSSCQSQPADPLGREAEKLEKERQIGKRVREDHPRKCRKRTEKDDKLFRRRGNGTREKEGGTSRKAPRDFDLDEIFIFELRENGACGGPDRQRAVWRSTTSGATKHRQRFRTKDGSRRTVWQI